MSWSQRRIRLRPRARGFHLVTDEVLNGIPELATLRCGLLHLLLQHTSASLCLNENADPDVRRDLAGWSDRAAPDNEAWYVHTCEGPDDMPAHIKSAVFGVSLLLPVTDGQLALGTWQGIYLGEHRDHASARTIVATLQGD
ncbi:MAG: secondary thiamine-phosphate synthase enzyme YjbQ [Planctomycetota bacterium]